MYTREIGKSSLNMSPFLREHSFTGFSFTQSVCMQFETDDTTGSK